MDEIVTLISTVGFPVAVAVYYMLVGHRDAKTTNETLNILSKMIENNTKTLERLCGK